MKRGTRVPEQAVRRQWESPPAKDRLADTLLALFAEHRPDDAAAIAVEIHGGTVRLIGVVAISEARAHAAQIAAALGGVDRVDNRLRVDACPQSRARR